MFLPEDACVSTKRRLCLYPKDACVSVRRRLCLYRKTGVFFRAARERGCGTPRTRRDAPTVGAVDLDPAFASKRRERAALTRLEALLPNAWGRPGQRLGRGRGDERVTKGGRANQLWYDVEGDISRIIIFTTPLAVPRRLLCRRQRQNKGEISVVLVTTYQRGQPRQRGDVQC